MDFMAQGSLLEGWSYIHNRPSDQDDMGNQKVSDLDLLIIVGDDYWDEIPLVSKISDKIPRTVVINKDNAGVVDPSLIDLIDMLEKLRTAGKTNRDVNIVIMPTSSFEKVSEPYRAISQIN